MPNEHVILDLTIPMRIKTPNKTRGHHWRTRHRETREWEQAIAAVGMTTSLPAWEAASLFLRAEAYVKAGRAKVRILRRQERRKVTITRYIERAQGMIEDRDNLAFSVKPINDALKRLHLIYDDNVKWLVQPLPEQVVTEDRTAYTTIRIERS